MGLLVLHAPMHFSLLGAPCFLLPLSSLTPQQHCGLTSIDHGTRVVVVLLLDPLYRYSRQLVVYLHKYFLGPLPTFFLFLSFSTFLLLQSSTHFITHTP
jgi:hypothetical protein